MDDDCGALAGGNMGGAVRAGDTVVREAGEWTPAVHRLLSLLGRAGIAGAPKPLGLTGDGREVVSYVEGVVPAYPMPPWVWEVSVLESAGRLLRRVHDATVGADPEGPWRSPVREPAEVVCHNDFAPYNLVFRDGIVVGAIDWDFASPGPRLWDLAYLAYRMVPLSTADWGDGFPEPVRRDRLRRLLAAYGSDAEPAEVVAVLRRRLLDLATFSEDMAHRRDNPGLREHARLYRRDAEHWRARSGRAPRDTVGE